MALMRDEALHLLLPLASPEVRSSWQVASGDEQAPHDGEGEAAEVDQPLAQQQGNEAVTSARALGEARRCGHLGCTNLAGISDTDVRVERCSGCHTVRFCGAECSKAAWRSHRAACRELQAAAAEAVAPAAAAAAAAAT